MFNMLKKEKRFIMKEDYYVGVGAVCIIVDTKTGVNYLATGGTALNAITPLLNSKGEVVIEGREEEREEL